MSASECASCGFPNRPGALFCGRCGTSLGMPCPTCGEVVTPGLPYCTACGAVVSAPLAPTPSAEERKVVSVLFADLVGSTSRAEHLDPEDVRRLLDVFHVRLKGELERYGGTVEKYIGDAVMALFGAPRAHEDDPERAVHAALSLREAIGELNAAEPELGLQLRVGVATGVAFVNLEASPAAGESMAAGDVVNTAARLQAAAPVDGILVDEATRRGSREAIDFREADPVRARGKSEAVTVWEAVARRAGLGVDIAFQGGAELVGRERELDLLLGSLSRAERERSPELVTLVGEPGIGKSRLLWELYSRLHADPAVFVNWRQGRSLPYGDGVSFWALGEIVKAHAGILESDAAGVAEEKLRGAVEAALTDEGEARWVLGHLRPLVGLGGDEHHAEGQTEAFAAWRRLFEALAERRLLVLVFEDIHWADDGLLDFVDHLVSWASGEPLLVVCTSRPELLERRPAWGGGKKNAVTTSLSPLSADETRRLVDSLLAGRHLRRERQSELLARAGGNPLYAEEYVRMLAEPGAGVDLRLPDSVHGIIAARLDALPPDQKAVLQDAAVVGKLFWPGAVAALGGLDEEAVSEPLRALERKEFVRRERRSSVAGQTNFVFRHGLVRDVAYGQIPRGRRAERHRRAAEWIESLAGDRSEDVADVLAHHYSNALELARAAGREIGELSDRAREALRDAGDRAFALHAFGTAARFYSKALELWPEDDPERPYLLLRFGQSAHFEGAGVAALEEAVEDLLDAGDREHAAEAKAVLCEILWHQGRHDEAFAELEGGAALLAEEPPSPSKAYVLNDLARFHMVADEAEAAVRAGFDAYVMAEELGLDDLRAHVLNSIGVARAMMGDRGGLVDLERSIGISRELKSAGVVRGLNNLASTLVTLGELDRALHLYAEARTEARRFGLAAPLRWLLAEQSEDHYWFGEWDEALELVTDLIREAEDGPRHLREVDARIVRALIRLARGDATGADDDSDRALEFAREAEDPQILFPALATRAFALDQLGRLDRADGLVEELMRRWRESPATPGSSWLAIAAAAAIDCRREADLVEAGATAHVQTKWLEAATTFATGDAAGAARLYAEIGSQPDEAYARMRAAAALLSAGHHAEGTGELGLAIGFFRRVRADAYLRAAESLLAPT